MTATASPLAVDASMQSLGRGAAGHALLQIERARTGLGSWARAHEQVMKMTGVPIAAHVDSSLFEGAPAVAYVLAVAAQAAYEPALATLDRHVDDLIRERLRRAHQRIDSGVLPGLREFDLISGLTGLGTYQLRRRRGGEVLDEVLEYVVRLCDPVAVEGQSLPGWWTDNDIADHPSEYWPGGHGNLGVAHGISGPLALLAIAARHGRQIQGQIDAIQTICSWLDRWQQGSGESAWWPGTITRCEFESGRIDQTGPQRPSWCYGTPGIARAQQLAGLALDDQARQHRAEAALLGCIKDTAQLVQLSDVTLCHGWAGLVQATTRAAADAGPGSSLNAELPELRRRLDDLAQGEGPQRHVGLLEGCDGVRLVQMSTASTAALMPPWDACLLLSG